MAYILTCGASLGVCQKLFMTASLAQIKGLTAMYGLQPASIVLATESTSWPLIPKSHIFISPRLLAKILEGLTSR